MIYAASDLHGCDPALFQALLRQADFSDDDFCFVLGDVIDRGLHSIPLLQWLMVQDNLQLLMGNHEALLLLSWPQLFGSSKGRDVLSHWERNGGGVTIAQLRALEPDEREGILEFVQELPLFDSVEAGGRSFLLTHSGFDNFRPDRSPDSYLPNELLWNRPALTDRYFDDALTILGHTPTLLYGREHAGKPLFTDTWIDIDAGAAAGYPPVLLRLDDLKVFTLSEGS